MPSKGFPADSLKLKFMFSKKATKIDEIFTVDLTLCSKCQIDGEDFFNFCGLLRKHELYLCIDHDRNEGVATNLKKKIHHSVTFKLKSLPWQYLGSNNALRFSKNDCIFTLHNSRWSSSNQMCLVYSGYLNNFVDPAIFSFGLYAKING